MRSTGNISEKERQRREEEEQRKRQQVYEILVNEKRQQFRKEFEMTITKSATAELANESSISDRKTNQLRKELDRLVRVNQEKQEQLKRVFEQSITVSLAAGETPPEHQASQMMNSFLQNQASNSIMRSTSLTTFPRQDSILQQKIHPKQQVEEQSDQQKQNRRKNNTSQSHSTEKYMMNPLESQQQQKQPPSQSSQQQQQSQQTPTNPLHRSSSSTHQNKFTHIPHNSVTLSAAGAHAQSSIMAQTNSIYSATPSEQEYFLKRIEDINTSILDKEQKAFQETYKQQEILRMKKNLIASINLEREKVNHLKRLKDTADIRYKNIHQIDVLANENNRMSSMHVETAKEQLNSVKSIYDQYRGKKKEISSELKSSNEKQEYELYNVQIKIQEGEKQNKLLEEEILRIDLEIHQREKRERESYFTGLQLWSFEEIERFIKNVKETNDSEMMQGVFENESPSIFGSQANFEDSPQVSMTFLHMKQQQTQSGGSSTGIAGYPAPIQNSSIIKKSSLQNNDNNNSSSPSKNRSLVAITGSSNAIPLPGTVKKPSQHQQQQSRRKRSLKAAAAAAANSKNNANNLSYLRDLDEIEPPNFDRKEVLDKIHSYFEDHSENITPTIDSIMEFFRDETMRSLLQKNQCVELIEQKKRATLQIARLNDEIHSIIENNQFVVTDSKAINQKQQEQLKEEPQLQPNVSQKQSTSNSPKQNELLSDFLSQNIAMDSGVLLKIDPHTNQQKETTVNVERFLEQSKERENLEERNERQRKFIFDCYLSLVELAERLCVTILVMKYKMDVFLSKNNLSVDLLPTNTLFAAANDLFYIATNGKSIDATFAKILDAAGLPKPPPPQISAIASLLQLSSKHTGSASAAALIFPTGNTQQQQQQQQGQHQYLKRGSSTFQISNPPLVNNNSSNNNNNSNTQQQQQMGAYNSRKSNAITTQALNYGISGMSYLNLDEIANFHSRTSSQTALSLHEDPGATPQLRMVPSSEQQTKPSQHQLAQQKLIDSVSQGILKDKMARQVLTEQFVRQYVQRVFDNYHATTMTANSNGNNNNNVNNIITQNQNLNQQQQPLTPPNAQELLIQIQAEALRLFNEKLIQVFKGFNEVQEHLLTNIGSLKKWIITRLPAGRNAGKSFIGSNQPPVIGNSLSLPRSDYIINSYQKAYEKVGKYFRNEEEDALQKFARTSAATIATKGSLIQTSSPAIPSQQLPQSTSQLSQQQQQQLLLQQLYATNSQPSQAQSASLQAQLQSMPVSQSIAALKKAQEEQQRKEALYSFIHFMSDSRKTAKTKSGTAMTNNSSLLFQEILPQNRQGQVQSNANGSGVPQQNSGQNKDGIGAAGGTLNQGPSSSQNNEQLSNNQQQSASLGAGPTVTFSQGTNGANIGLGGQQSNMPGGGIGERSNINSQGNEASGKGILLNSNSNNINNNNNNNSNNNNSNSNNNQQKFYTEEEFMDEERRSMKLNERKEYEDFQFKEEREKLLMEQEERKKQIVYHRLLSTADTPQRKHEVSSFKQFTNNTDLLFKINTLEGTTKTESINQFSDQMRAENASVSAHFQKEFASMSMSYLKPTRLTVARRNMSIQSRRVMQLNSDQNQSQQTNNNSSSKYFLMNKTTNMMNQTSKSLLPYHSAASSSAILAASSASLKQRENTLHAVGDTYTSNHNSESIRPIVRPHLSHSSEKRFRSVNSKSNNNESSLVMSTSNLNQNQHHLVIPPLRNHSKNHSQKHNNRSLNNNTHQNLTTTATVTSTSSMKNLSRNIKSPLNEWANNNNNNDHNSQEYLQSAQQQQVNGGGLILPTPILFKHSQSTSMLIQQLPGLTNQIPVHYKYLNSEWLPTSSIGQAGPLEHGMFDFNEFQGYEDKRNGDSLQIPQRKANTTHLKERKEKPFNF